MRGLTGKTAIVTGGASGIGRAICRRLGMEGCIVGIFDIDAEGAVETGRLVTEGGGTAHPQTVDIGDYRAVEEAFAAFETTAGQTVTLANNAGWDQPFNFIDTEIGRETGGERGC